MGSVLTDQKNCNNNFPFIFTPVFVSFLLHSSVKQALLSLQMFFRRQELKSSMEHLWDGSQHLPFIVKLQWSWDNVRCFGDRGRHTRLICFGRVQSGGEDYICTRMLRMQTPGRSLRGGPKLKLMYVVQEDMKLGGVRIEDAENTKWRRMIQCGNPCREKTK